MKKSIALLLAIGALLCSTACQAQQPYPPDEPHQESDSTTQVTTTIAQQVITSTLSHTTPTNSNSQPIKCPHSVTFFNAYEDYHEKICWDCKAVLLTGEHTLTLDEKTFVPGTCTEPGYAFYECLICRGYTHSDELTVPHEPIIWEQVEEASCLSPAKFSGKCKWCGILLEKHEGSKTPHDFQPSGVCNNCGASKNDAETTTELSTTITQKLTTTQKPTTTTIQKASTTQKPPTTTPVLSNVLIISDTQTLSDQTINTDVYITSTGVATFKNMVVNGDVYCYGKLIVSGGKVNNVYAYFWDLGGISASCDAWDGAHGLVKGSFKTSGSIKIEDDALDYAFNEWGKK